MVTLTLDRVGVALGRRRVVRDVSAAFAAGHSHDAPISAESSLPTSAGRIQKPT